MTKISTRFRLKAPIIILVLFLEAFAGYEAAAKPANGRNVEPLRRRGWDYSLELDTLANPFRGMLRANFGYGIYLWRSRDVLSEDWKYGYLRPSVQAKTFGVYNGAEIKLSFFPISFVGIHVGYSGLDRLSNVGSIDCSTTYCKEIVTRRFYIGEWYAGLGPGVIFTRVGVENLNHTFSDQPFYDDESRLIGGAGGDQLFTWTGFIGTGIGTKTMVGIMAHYNKMASRVESAKSAYLIVTRLWKDLAITGGVGMFHSHFEPRLLSATFSLKWVGKKEIGL